MPSPGVHPLREVIARALYDPADGYYTRHVAAIGRGGDFSTLATLGVALGRAVAAWMRKAGRGIPAVIEVGAGDGSLARAVRSALPWGHRFRRARHFVEVSAPLQLRQQETLRGRGIWHDDMHSALAACGGRALIVANELIDAFPPTVLEWDGQRWSEVALAVGDDGAVREVVIPWLATDAASPGLDPSNWPGGAPATGQRIERLDSFRDWMLAWIGHWSAGSLLWIDYGDHFPILYHRRPQGTLRAYAGHQRLVGQDVFRRLGRQDITCDVDFTDLRRWGQEAGLHTCADESQGEFLRRFHVRVPDDPAAADGPAQAFRVLWQERA